MTIDTSDRRRMKRERFQIFITILLTIVVIIGVTMETKKIFFDDKEIKVVTLSKIEDNYLLVLVDGGETKVAFIKDKDIVPLVKETKIDKKSSSTNESNLTPKEDTKPVPDNKDVGSSKIAKDKVQRLDQDKLKADVAKILHELPCVESTDKLQQLILETMTAETELMKNVPIGGGAYGNVQMLPSTAKYMLKWTKENEPDTYRYLTKKYNKDLSIRDNLIRNMEFQIAMCSVYYYHRTKGNPYKYIATLEDRAKLWKREYNTHLGAGTAQAYIKRVKRHLG